MGRNLAILYFLDKIFSCYNDLESNSLAQLFNTTSPIIHKFGSNIISSIPNSNLEPNVQIQLDCGKISGTYKVEAVGFTSISNIKIQEKDLIKNKIPSFDNFIERLDNIKEILKITNILSLNKKFTYKSNCSNQEFDLMFINENYKNIWDLFKQEDKEKKLLRSNSNYAFYIKIYEDYSKAFIIDKTNNLIYYLVSNENFKKGSIFIRYYSLKINNNYKIKSIYNN
jgi:hypothetical protein